MSCRHACATPPVFPQAIYNRPGLDTIFYRVGMYTEMRAYLLDRLNQRPELDGWTHRGADDPGIALLESGAVVADILTFYQQLYANEAWLRTAKWQESLFDLVRLLGYRPAPGVGGNAVFALKVKGDTPVTVPKGFGFKVKLAGDPQQSEFETSAQTAAYSFLSEFALYRSRLSPRNITPANAGNQLELQAVNGSTLLADLTAVQINKGDRIMLVPDATMFDVTGAAYSTQANNEILVVNKVETALDRVTITFEGALTENRGRYVDAFLIKRSFRHFGNDAPPLTATLAGSPPVTTLTPTRFIRQIWGDDRPGSPEANYYSPVMREDMLLDKDVNDLAAGGSLICEGRVAFDGQSTPVPFTVVRRIEKVRSDSLTWGNKSGAATVATLDRRLMANTSILNEFADIRRLRFHETAVSRLTLRCPTAWTTGAFTDTGLNFFGTLEEAQALQGRSLLLAGVQGDFQEVNINGNLPSLATAAGGTNRQMWEVLLDRPPAFTRESFDEQAPAITVYGNLAPASQGKTQSSTTLGSGDNRQDYQTLALPKAPLTYLLNGAAEPPQVPQLTVYVDKVKWDRVDTLFNAAADDKVYIVREDDQGKSSVQFGNGVMGSRLPSGINNVTAVYRKGLGGNGLPDGGAEPKASGRLQGLDKVVLPAPVTGGAQPETQAVARTAAPGRMQSLGRLVSLADYESEVLTIPGVVKARAYWSAPEGSPAIQLIVLTQTGTVADLEAVRASMATYDRCKGPVRYPLAVVQGIRQYLHVAITVGYDPARLPEDITTAVKLALGVTGEEGNGLDAAAGLFGLDNRTFSQSAHVSQIVGRVQEAGGVRWVLADAAQPIDPGTPPETDPALLAIPATRAVYATIGCAPTRILALYTKHLELNLVADERKEPCAV